MVRSGRQTLPQWRAKNEVLRRASALQLPGLWLFHKLLCFSGWHHRPLPLTDIPVLPLLSLWRFSLCYCTARSYLHSCLGYLPRLQSPRLVFFPSSPYCTCWLGPPSAHRGCTAATPPVSALSVCDRWQSQAIFCLIEYKTHQVPCANVRTFRGICFADNI